MSLSALVSQFASDTANGSTTKTILSGSVAPKAAIFSMVPRSSDGNNPSAEFWLGVAVDIGGGTIRQWSLGFTSADAAATSSVTTIQRNAEAMTRGSSTTTVRTSVTSFSADSVTLNNIAVTGATSRQYGVLALGGADLSDCDAVNFQAPTATGDLDVALDFNPDFILLAAVCKSNSNNITHTQQNAHFAIGVATPTEQSYTATYTEHGNATNAVTKKYQGQDAAFAMIDASSAFLKCTWVGNPTSGTGIKLNFSAVDATNPPYLYVLALKGCRYKISTFNQLTSLTPTAVQSVTGHPGQPVAAIFMGNQAAESASVGNDLHFAWGMASGSGAQLSQWLGDANGQATQWANNNLNSSNVISALTLASGTPTLNSQAAFTSFDSTGYTVTWGSVSGTANEWVSVAFIANATAAPGEFDVTVMSEALHGSAGYDATVMSEALQPGIGGGGTTVTNTVLAPVRITRV